MHLSSEEKAEIFEKYGKGKIATASLRLPDYLMRKDITRYRAIIAKKELGIRK